MPFFGRTNSLVLVLALLCASQACFYDHRVVQQIQEKRRAAKEAEGAKLHTSNVGTLPPKHVGQVRFYVAEDFRKQHPDWRHMLEALVESASAVLRPEFGVTLELSELHEWSPHCPQGELDVCLEELQELPAEPYEWVVGVRGILPTFTSSFEALGLAEVPGQHFVIRDISDLAEREAIEQAFPTLTANRKAEIYQRRKQHKRLAVFLHEWAHTLGALHVRSSDTLLHPSYDDRMAGFGTASSALISAGLEDRFKPNPHHEALIAALDSASQVDMEASEVSELLDHVRRMAAGGDVVAKRQMPEHPFVVKGPEDTLLSGVSEPDRVVYREAVRLLLAGEHGRSLEQLRPIIERYPACYAIQHLACGLAMQEGQRDVQALCSRAQALAGPH